LAIFNTIFEKSVVAYFFGPPCRPIGPTASIVHCRLERTHDLRSCTSVILT